MSTTKRRRAAEAVAEAERLAALPIHKRYSKQLATFVLAVTSVITGLFVHNHSEQVKAETAKQEAARQAQVSADKAKYGNLYEMRKRIPESMIQVADDGKYMFEYFLPRLQREADGRWRVNVCLDDNPDTEQNFSLSSVPKSMQAEIMKGLEPYHKSFSIHQVADPEKADVKVYMDNDATNGSNMFASTPRLGKMENGMLARRKDMEKLGPIILINPSKAADLEQYPHLLESTITHEFGHLVGLMHPEEVISFIIRKHGGFTDLRQVPFDLKQGFATAMHDEFPQLSKFTIMNMGTDKTQAKTTPLMEFDLKALERISELFKQKYGEHYQPPAKPLVETGYDNSKWREYFAKQKLAAAATSLDGSPLR